MIVMMTQELFDKGKSANGGWNRKQIECLGEQWPQVAGWMTRILAREYPEETIERFLELRTPDEKFAKKFQANNDASLLARFKSFLAAKGVIANGKAFKVVRLMNASATKNSCCRFSNIGKRLDVRTLNSPSPVLSNERRPRKRRQRRPKHCH